MAVGVVWYHFYPYLVAQLLESPDFLQKLYDVDLLTQLSAGFGKEALLAIELNAWKATHALNNPSCLLLIKLDLFLMPFA